MGQFSSVANSEPDIPAGEAEAIEDDAVGEAVEKGR